MKNFAFRGASGALDRAAHFRADPSKIAAFWETALVTPLWRGKVAVDGRGGLEWVGPLHPARALAQTPIFLGLVQNQPLFAVDISAWQPDTPQDTAQGFFDHSLQPHPDLDPDAGFTDLRAVMSQLSPLDAECAAIAKALLSWHDSHRFCARCGSASAAQNAGWQRQCPACHTPHFPRTDPVVIMLVIRNDNLLLGRSSGWPEGMYSLLAGFVEPGETPEDAVRREVFEETGVRIGDVQYVTSQPWPFPANLMLGCIARANSDAITVDPAELEDALWLTRQQVLDMQLGRNLKVKGGRKGAIATVLIEDWLSGRID
jgi:NAD+ diphosphatase